MQVTIDHALVAVAELIEFVEGNAASFCASLTMITSDHK